MRPAVTGGPAQLRVQWRRGSGGTRATGAGPPPSATPAPPHATPATSPPPPTLPPRLATALRVARPSTRARVSYRNVLYVVSAPQNPTPSPARTASGTAPGGRAATAPVSAPSTAEPATLTANVPHGNRPRYRALTAWSTR